MKPLFITMLLLLCIAANAQSCLPLAIEDARTDAYLQNRNPAVLTVRIKGVSDSARQVAIKCTFVTFGADFQTEGYYSTDKNGFAKIVLGQNLPYQQIWLNVGKYLYAGVYLNTDLKITIDANQIKNKDGVYMTGDGVAYSGTDGVLNTVMNKHVLYRKEEQDKLSQELISSGQTRKKTGDRLYLNKIDSIEKALGSINKAFIQQYPKYAWAINNETASLICQWLCASYIGDKMPKSILERINGHKPYFTSNDATQFYRVLSMYTADKTDNPRTTFDNTVLFDRYDHYDARRKSLLDSIKYYSALSKEGRSKDSLQLVRLYNRQNNLFATDIAAFYVNNTLKIIDSIYTKPKADILKFYLLEKGKNSFASVYPHIINSMKTAWCIRLTAKELKIATRTQRKTDSLLACSRQFSDTGRFIGNPLERLSFGADLYQLDSIKSVDDLILNLQSKFKNKALVIDLWATWCGPCLNDLPYSKKLHEANKDLPVQYIYICTNSSSNADVWKKKIAELQLSGTHIFMDEKIVSELKSSFNSAGSGFPTYIAIDISGKFHTNAIQEMQFLDRDHLKSIVGIP